MENKKDKQKRANILNCGMWVGFNKFIESNGFFDDGKKRKTKCVEPNEEKKIKKSNKKILKTENFIHIIYTRRVLVNTPSALRGK